MKFEIKQENEEVFTEVEVLDNTQEAYAIWEDHNIEYRVTYEKEGSKKELNLNWEEEISS